MKTTNKLNWNDIVFEFKNKDYGAFFLRKIYHKDITIASGITLLILLLLVGPPFIMAKFNKTNNTKIENKESNTFVEYKPEVMLPPPPPPVLPPVEDINKAGKFNLIVVDTTNMIIDIPITDDMIDSSKFKQVIDDDLVYTKPPDDVFIPLDIPTFAEEMPEFPGGEAAMLKFIVENFVYPEKSKAVGSEGRVYVNFVVNENGEIVQVGITRGVDEYIDKEAIRVIKSMPNWIPAKQNGQIVKLKLFIPINCTLSE